MKEETINYLDNVYNELIIIKKNILPTLDDNELISKYIKSFKAIMKNILKTNELLSKFNERYILNEIIIIDSPKNDICINLINKINEAYKLDILSSLEEYYNKDKIYEDIIILNNFKFMSIVYIMDDIYNNLLSKFINIISNNIENNSDSDE